MSEPESIERQFVRWVYRDPSYERMPHRPASMEPRRRPSTEPLPPINKVLFALTAAGCAWRPTRNVDSWQAHCPCHEDARASLTVRRNADGNIWLKCWAGCSKEAVLAALGLQWRDLFDGGQYDPGRERGLNVRPVLPANVRRAMEGLLRLDEERRSA